MSDADNLVYNTSSTTWAANATQIYSKEQEQSAVYVIVVVLTYACSIFALLVLVLCKKKRHVAHTDRDVDRFLRGIESVRDVLRRREQKHQVHRFLRGISKSREGELERSLSMEDYLDSEHGERVKVKPPLRRTVSEGARTAKAVHSEVPTGSFQDSTDSETAFSPMLQPPSYEELKLKSVGGSTDTTHCQSCTCYLPMRHQKHLVPVPVTPPGTEFALVHQPVTSVKLSNLTGEQTQLSLPNLISPHSTPSQYNGRPMLHQSSGPTRIPRPVIPTTMPRLPFIDENEEHA